MKFCLKSILLVTKYLLDRSWTGRNVLAVHGAADLSFEAAAKILSSVLGKKITYVFVQPEQFRQVLLSHGASADGSEQFLLMFRAVVEQNAYAAEPRTPETTTATTLAQWVSFEMLPTVKSSSVEKSKLDG